MPANTPTKFMTRLKMREDDRESGVGVDPVPVPTQTTSMEPDPHIDHRHFTEHPSNGTSHHSNPSGPIPSNEGMQDAHKRIRELEDEVQSLRAERDDLVHEKKFWLTRFQTDNAKLTLLLSVSPTLLL